MLVYGTQDLGVPELRSGVDDGQLQLPGPADVRSVVQDIGPDADKKLSCRRDDFVIPTT